MNVLRGSGNPSSEAVLACWAWRGWRGVHSQPLDNHGRPYHNTPTTPLINTRSFIHSDHRQLPPETWEYDHDRPKWSPIPAPPQCRLPTQKCMLLEVWVLLFSCHRLCLLVLAGDQFSMVLFASEHPYPTSQAYFFVLLPYTFSFGHPFYIGTIFVIMMGLLPAVMLRQGVTQGRPARWTNNLGLLNNNHLISRILVWVFSIGSQAIMCILFTILPNPGFSVSQGTLLYTIGHQIYNWILPGFQDWKQLQAEILFFCLAFTIAAVVSLVSCCRIQFTWRVSWKAYMKGVFFVISIFVLTL